MDFDASLRTYTYMTAADHLNRARALLALGQWAAAQRAAETAIEQGAADAEAYTIRGLAIGRQGLTEAALASFDAGIALQPDHVLAHVNRGVMLRRLGRFTEALASQEAALALDPANFEAQANRVVALLKLERFEQALASAERTMAARPDRAAGLLAQRAEALAGLERLEEALGAFDAAIASQPNNAELYIGRGRVLLKRGRHEEAWRDAKAATALDPRFADAHVVCGRALTGLTRIEEAIESYGAAAALRPKDGAIKFDAGCLNLLIGRFETGWTLYNQRPGLQRILEHRRLVKPLWSGEQDIDGKTLFVYTDQGLGDAIQFCRYARLAEQRGAAVVLSVQAGLHRILRSLSPTIRLMAESETPADLDLHCPLSSLPRGFGTDLASIPRTARYLAAESDRVELWRRRLGSEGFRIGVCWQGSALNGGLGRSFALRELDRISRLPGVRLISLQKFDGVGQLDDLPPGMHIEALGPGFDAGPDTFLDAAAVIEVVDLVITCDTSIAHLGGALGKPTWVVLKQVPDWRWMLQREDSPWYPSLRLFRQSTDGVWSDVFERIHREITRAKCRPAH
jgi:tetratricopeptide (TPR) repeat protein